MAGAPEAGVEGEKPQAARIAQAVLRLVSQHGAAASALGVRLGAAGLAYLLQIVLARSLGAADYGTFSFSWSLVTIGGFIATLGFGQIGVRFLAQYHQQGQHGLAQGFLRAGIMASLGGSLAMAMLLFAASPLVERGYGELCTHVLAIGLIALPFFALTDFMEGVARSQGWTIRALVPPYIIRQGAIIVILLFALAIGTRINAEIAMLAALVATLVAALVQVLLIAGKLRTTLPLAPPAYAFRDWMTAARPTLLSDLALLARQNIDLIVLGLMAPASAVGLYFAATRIASLLGLIDFAVGAAFGHRFARAVNTDGTTPEAPALRTLYAEARRLTLGPGLLAALMLILAAPLIMMLFGPAFAEAVVPTQILLAAGALRLAIGPAEDALGMAGHPDVVWRANAIGALVMAILCLLLTRDMQAVGAALSAAGGIVAANLMLVLGLRRYLGLSLFGLPAAREAA
ncbi:MAG: polysaccharide export protein PST [Beijerinckiaceae bacterium]|nr:MAG: polysaccharide export protein PST [Beijerinckiaceae bacterium]